MDPTQVKKLSTDFELVDREDRFPDGRPVRIQDWYEADLQLVLRSFFYSRSDIESFSAADHRRYLEEAGFLSNQEENKRGGDLGIKSLDDNAGHSIWSVTIGLRSVEL